MNSDYIIFVDESGDHSLDKIDQAYPVFVLAFCVMPFPAYNESIAPAIRELKFSLFGHDMVVFHESDIVRKRNAFARLGAAQRDELMLKLSAILKANPDARAWIETIAATK